MFENASNLKMLKEIENQIHAANNMSIKIYLLKSCFCYTLCTN